MKEQPRNTEVQINEEEIGKLPEKKFRIMIANMIKTLEQNGITYFHQFKLLLLNRRTYFIALGTQCSVLN